MFFICLTTSGNMAARNTTVAQAMVAHHGSPADDCMEFSSDSNQSVGQPTPDAIVATFTGAAAATVADAASEATLAATSETVLAGAAAAMDVAGKAAAAALAVDAGAAAAAGAALNQPKRRTVTPWRRGIGKCWTGCRGWRGAGNGKRDCAATRTMGCTLRKRNIARQYCKDVPLL
jgi:hypothetical protein